MFPARSIMSALIGREWLAAANSAVSSYCGFAGVTPITTTHRTASSCRYLPFTFLTAFPKPDRKENKDAHNFHPLTRSLARNATKKSRPRRKSNGEMGKVQRILELGGNLTWRWWDLTGRDVPSMGISRKINNCLFNCGDARSSAWQGCAGPQVVGEATQGGHSAPLFAEMV